MGTQARRLREAMLQLHHETDVELAALLVGALGVTDASGGQDIDPAGQYGIAGSP
jgi:hypothetical protein